MTITLSADFSSTTINARKQWSKVSSYCSYCYTVHGVLRQEYWSGLPFPSPVDHILSDLSTMTCPSWVALWAWLGFIELDKAVVLVWLDWLVFCEYGFSVSALWCPLVTPTILLGFLLPWAWGISSRLLQQITGTAPYLGRGVSPYRIHQRLQNRDGLTLSLCRVLAGALLQ